MTKGELFELIKGLPDETEICVTENNVEDIYTGDFKDTGGLFIDITEGLKAVVYLKIKDMKTTCPF